MMRLRRKLLTSSSFVAPLQVQAIVAKGRTPNKVVTKDATNKLRCATRWPSRAPVTQKTEIFGWQKWITVRILDSTDSSHWPPRYVMLLWKLLFSSVLWLVSMFPASVTELAAFPILITVSKRWRHFALVVSLRAPLQRRITHIV